MAQTLVRVLVHLIFSTKGRANLISPEVESELARVSRRNRKRP